MSLHLPLDVLFNSQRLGLNLAPFYSIVYRARGGFRSDVLLGITAPRPEAGGFWRGFFAEFFPAPLPRAPGVARPLRAGRPIPSSRLAA